MQKFPKMLATYLLEGNYCQYLFIQQEIDHNHASGGIQVLHFITYTEDGPSKFGKAYTLVKKSLLRQHSVVLNSSTSELLRATLMKQPECSMS